MHEELKKVKFIRFRVVPWIVQCKSKQHLWRKLWIIWT